MTKIHTSGSQCRALTSEELMLVAGGFGDVTVTGRRGTDEGPANYFEYILFNTYNPYDYGGNLDDGGEGGEEPSSDSSAATDILEATADALTLTKIKIDALRDLIAKMGPETLIRVPSHIEGAAPTLIKATDLLDSVTKIKTGLEGFVVVGQIVNGDKDGYTAINFLFGGAVGAAAAEAGAGAVLAGIIGLTAEAVANNAVNFIDAVKELSNEFKDQARRDIAEFVQSHAPADVRNAPVSEAGNVIRGMLGIQTGPFNRDYDFDQP